MGNDRESNFVLQHFPMYLIFLHDSSNVSQLHISFVLKLFLTFLSWLDLLSTFVTLFVGNHVWLRQGGDLRRPQHGHQTPECDVLRRRYVRRASSSHTCPSRGSYRLWVMGHECTDPRSWYKRPLPREEAMFPELHLKRRTKPDGTLAVFWCGRRVLRHCLVTNGAEWRPERYASEVVHSETWMTLSISSSKALFGIRHRNFVVTSTRRWRRSRVETNDSTGRSDALRKRGGGLITVLRVNES